MWLRLLPVGVIVFKVLKFMFYDTKDVYAATINPYEEMKKLKQGN